MSDQPTIARRRRSETPYKAATPDADDFDPDFDTPASDSPWNYDMAGAPRDGSEVALLLSGNTTDYKLVTWRKSRRMIGYKWQPEEGWSDRFTRQMYFDIQPLAWARHDIIDGLRKG